MWILSLLFHRLTNMSKYFCSSVDLRHCTFFPLHFSLFFVSALSQTHVFPLVVFFFHTTILTLNLKKHQINFFLSFCKLESHFRELLSLMSDGRRNKNHWDIEWKWLDKWVLFPHVKSDVNRVCSRLPEIWAHRKKQNVCFNQLLPEW